MATKKHSADRAQRRSTPLQAEPEALLKTILATDAHTPAVFDPKTRPVGALMQLWFHWLGLDKPVGTPRAASDETRLQKAAREARERCGRELLDVMSLIPIDARSATDAQDKVVRERDGAVLALARSALDELSLATDKFQQIAALTDTIATNGDDEGLLSKLLSESAIGARRTFTHRLAELEGSIRALQGSAP